MSARRSDARVTEAVTASLDLIRRHGLDELTLKRLSYRLSMPEHDLTKLVGDRQELVLRCLDTLVAQVEVPDSTAGDWIERSRSMAMSFWDTLAQYPGVAQHIITFQQVSPAMLTMVEVGIELLVAGGFDELRATDLFMALAGMVMARSALDANRHLEWGRDETGATTTRERFLGVERWRRTADEVELDQLPLVAGYLKRAEERGWTRVVFATELDLMLRGIDSLPR